MSPPEPPPAELEPLQTPSERVNYGHTTLERGLCSICNVYSFIQDNKFIFCNHSCNSTIISVKQESITNNKLNRKLPTHSKKDLILKEQRYKCAYCDREFGRNLRLVWDHFLPFSIYQNNSTDNFVASCVSCNSIKHNRIFNTINEVREYVKEKRKIQGTKNLSGLRTRIHSVENESTILQSTMSMECVVQKASKNQITQLQYINRLVNDANQICIETERMILIIFQLINRSNQV